jgi:S-adenosylmethionine decarboxylase
MDDKILGKHYLLNLYNCDKDLLDDEQFIRTMLENAALECGATLLETISYKFQPQGVTAVALLAESHISIHTWPEKGSASVDVFTCGDSNPSLGGLYIQQSLKCTVFDNQLVMR